MSAPLVGLRVLLPRPAGRTAELADMLVAAGARVVAVPLIEIAPAADDSELRSAVADLAAGAFDWIAFTAVPAVDAVLATAARIGVAPLPPEHTRVAAVGAATARALRRAGLPVNLQPAAHGSAAALAATWPAEPAGRFVLLPRSDIASATLPDALRAAGYRIRTVVAYRTAPLPAPPELVADLASGALDAVLLTSPSAARALAASLTGTGIASRTPLANGTGTASRTPLANGTVIIAIGHSTAAAAAAAGLPADSIAREPTPAALIAALLAARAAGANSKPAAGPTTGPNPDRTASPALTSDGSDTCHAVSR